VIKIKTTIVLCCTDYRCGYGYSESGASIEVQGLVTIPARLDIDSVPSDVEVATTEFTLPAEWQQNYNGTEFRCPEHHDRHWRL
jgi:hypothetical protein